MIPSDDTKKDKPFTEDENKGSQAQRCEITMEENKQDKSTWSEKFNLEAANKIKQKIDNVLNKEKKPRKPSLDRSQKRMEDFMKLDNNAMARVQSLPFSIAKKRRQSIFNSKEGLILPKRRIPQ
jgi:hypothetical protein